MVASASIRRIALLCCLLVLLPGLSFGAARVTAAPTVYTVAPNGNNANPGSTAAPFRTIQHAASVAEPGDTVVVRAGDYGGNGHSPTLR
ncbi:DUF1565 domain-containing protein [Candidatus Gracilibacteria bacterium]|nr:DUF1565 domain-containing protein [Candidatus Gracilibacteria bacterium]